jgi:ketosteroid isomerase-like protein
MRKSIAWLAGLMLAVSTLPVWADGLSQADRDIIAGAKKSASMSWKVYVDSHYDEAAKVIPPNFPLVVGKQAIEAYFTSLPAGATFRFVDDEISGEGNLAYVRGSYTLTYTNAQGNTVREKGNHLEIWGKYKDGTWRSILQMFSPTA